MREKYLFLFGIIGLFLLVGGHFVVVVPQEKARTDALTFSNTALWDPYYLALAEKPTRYPAEAFSNLSLPSPPPNSSHETTAELVTLRSYRDLRTPQEREDILVEADLDTTYFGGHTLTRYMDGQQFPATALLLKDSFHDLTVVTMREKRKFDRVRPSVLDPSLDTVLIVPGHPSYPSAHSTQMHFLAYVFGELAPMRKEEFLARANYIAKNREIAGVHYPSDTRAGVLLAQQFFIAIRENSQFQELLTAARKEWR